MDGPKANLTVEYLAAELEKFPDLSLDLIGNWTILKETVLEDYLLAYNAILENVPSQYEKRPLFTRHFIDGFAGAGIHRHKITKELIAGSALRAVRAVPSFDSITLVDADPVKCRFLRETLGIDPRVEIIEGDANLELPSQVFPSYGYKTFRKGLCFLDPYKLCLNWNTVVAASKAGQDSGGKGSIEVFINYPNHDVRRNLLRDRPEDIRESDSTRMTQFWGDESWKSIVYTSSPKQGRMFMQQGEQVRDAGEQSLIDGYAQRLKERAGFEHVVGPLRLVNTVKARIFLLFFATHDPTAARAARGVFKKNGAT